MRIQFFPVSANMRMAENAEGPLVSVHDGREERKTTYQRKRGREGG